MDSIKHKGGREGGRERDQYGQEHFSVCHFSCALTWPSHPFAFRYAAAVPRTLTTGHSRYARRDVTRHHDIINTSTGVTVGNRVCDLHLTVAIFGLRGISRLRHRRTVGQRVFLLCDGGVKELTARIVAAALRKPCSVQPSIVTQTERKRVDVFLTSYYLN